jgi:hypothetical protein
VRPSLNTKYNPEEEKQLQVRVGIAEGTDNREKTVEGCRKGNSIADAKENGAEGNSAP